MNLSILIIVPLITAFVVLMCPKLPQVRWVAFSGSMIQLILSIVLLRAYYIEREIGSNAQFLFQEHHAWFKALNIEYFIGVDGISIAMILLTAFVVCAGVLISWKMETLTKEFFFRSEE